MTYDSPKVVRINGKNSDICKAVTIVKPEEWDVAWGGGWFATNSVTLLM